MALIQESSPGGGGSSDAATETTLQSVLARLLTILTELAQKTEPLDTQTIAGVVAVTNFPATQPVSGPLTDVQLRATAVPVATGLVQPTTPTDTQPISAATLPLPTGAATDTSLAALLAELSDKLDEATFTGRLGEVQASPTANTVLARLKDLLTELSQKTEPADQQHAIVDSSALPTDAATQTTLALIKAKTDNLDVALSTRTKPADTQVTDPSDKPTRDLGKVDIASLDQYTPVSGRLPVDPSGVTSPVDVTDKPARDLGKIDIASLDQYTPVAGRLPVDGSGVTQPVSGVVSTKTDLAPSAPTFATVGVASAQAVAAAATRKGLILVNTSGNTISLGFGATAVLNSGVTLLAGMAFSMDEYSFDLAAVNAIASAASSNLAIQEYLT